MVSIRRSELAATGAASAVTAAQRARPWEPAGRIGVEQLVHWAIADQMVERFASVGLFVMEAEAAGFDPHGRSACGVARLIDIGNLGCAIDVSGPVRDAVHPVAYAVDRALAAVERKAAALVRYHARSGTRPTQWMPPERFVRPAHYAADGRSPQIEYQGPGRKGAFCSIIIVWDAARQAFGRETYLRWWDGLDALAWECSKMALGFTVEGPSAPREPWA